MIKELHDKERQPSHEDNGAHFAQEDRGELTGLDDRSEEKKREKVNNQSPDLAKNDYDVACLHLLFTN